MKSICHINTFRSYPVKKIKKILFLRIIVRYQRGREGGGGISCIARRSLVSKYRRIGCRIELMLLFK